MQTGCPLSLRLECEIESFDARKTETALHSHFKLEKTEGAWFHGEWFDFGRENPKVIVRAALESGRVGVRRRFLRFKTAP